MSVKWLAELRDSTGVLYRIGRDGHTRIADWPGLVTMHCGPSGEPAFTEVDGADPVRLAKVKHGLARALVRSLSGGITLHASAVASGGRAVLCLGASGQGKSTLAAALCVLPRMVLVADDMAPIEEMAEQANYFVTPSERAVWLAPGRDALGKAPYPLPFATEPCAVAALVTLAFSDEEGAAATTEPRLRALTPVEVFGRLIPSVVRFGLDDPRAHERELAALGRLTRRLPAFELLRPRDLGHLAGSAQLLAGLFAQGYSAA